MIKYIFIFIALASCKSSKTIINDHVDIVVYTYEYEGKLKASAMPELRSESEMNQYKRRFEYLLINVSEIHTPKKAEKRKEIWSLYPDTIKLKRLYIKQFAKDKNLVMSFEATSRAIIDTTIEVTTSFTTDDLMEVASKFFYCDKVFPDTTVQSHVCLGLNGVSEANWHKDYTLLEAFCYEVIFNDLVEGSSQIDESYSSEKSKACQKFKPSITTLDKYLLDVRKELFFRMKQDLALKRLLIEYYEENRANLAFQIIN
ncbi:MAG: hypothetical protein ACI837_002456 [Crocinitomicaceae bacterium]|jgi:hypothetical protein